MASDNTGGQLLFENISYIFYEKLEGRIGKTPFTKGDEPWRNEDANGPGLIITHHTRA